MALPLLAALTGCPQGEGARAPSHSALKVPLPEGWRASASSDGVLKVKTEGREVLTMEVRPDAEVPSSEALQAAVAEGGGESLGALPLPDGVLLRYRVSTGAEGVLGVRRLEGRRLLCASEPAAQQGELKMVARLCSEATMTVSR